MKNIDYNYLANRIGDLTGMPIRIYLNNELCYYYSIVTLPQDPMKPYLKEILNIDNHIGYYVTNLFHYYGIVNASPYKIVIGPSMRSKNTLQELKELAFTCDCDNENSTIFINNLKSIVSMPLNSLVEMLCTINYILNNEKLTLDDCIIVDLDQKNIKQDVEQRHLENNIVKEDSDDWWITSHNTLSVEQTIVNYIRHGNVEELKKWIKQAPALTGGILAENEIRQYKNIFICAITIFSRAAIQGGMDPDDSLSLSDAYIQKLEILTSIEQVLNLQYHMILDFAERVNKIRHGDNPSKLVQDVTNYIHHHLSEPITTIDIAKALYISRSRLSVKFKQEAKENLNDFIMKEKIEEAKNLLIYTEKTLVSIALYLGFSSQSHFTKTFKKYQNMSPLEYRKKHNKC